MGLYQKMHMVMVDSESIEKRFNSWRGEKILTRRLARLRFSMSLNLF